MRVSEVKEIRLEATGELVTVQIFEAVTGQREVGDTGYYEPTDALGWIGDEIDEDEKPTGRRIAYAGNGAEGEAWATACDSIYDAVRDVEIDEDGISGLWDGSEMMDSEGREVGFSRGDA